VDVVNWGNASNPYFTAPEEGFANFLNRNCTSPSCSHQPSKWFSCHPPACVDYGESPNIGTPVAVNPLFPSVAAGAFIITEVSVKPPLADVTKEWFEVLNTTGSMQYLEALQVVQGSNRATIPSTPAIRVPAGEYRVISSATMPTSCGQACRAVYTWGDALSLPDGGGTLSLTASSEVDSVSWVDDPNELFTPVEGKSGYLKSTCRLQSCSNDPGNWASCQPPACVDIGSGYGYGTPGTQNP
jgi:hypothetical protein